MLVRAGEVADESFSEINPAVDAAGLQAVQPRPGHALEHERNVLHGACCRLQCSRLWSSRPASPPASRSRCIWVCLVDVDRTSWRDPIRCCGPTFHDTPPSAVVTSRPRTRCTRNRGIEPYGPARENQSRRRHSRTKQFPRREIATKRFSKASSKT